MTHWLRSSIQRLNVTRASPRCHGFLMRSPEHAPVFSQPGPVTWSVARTHYEATGRR